MYEKDGPKSEILMMNHDYWMVLKLQFHEMRNSKYTLYLSLIYILTICLQRIIVF